MHRLGAAWALDDGTIAIWGELGRQVGVDLFAAEQAVKVQYLVGPPGRTVRAKHALSLSKRWGWLRCWWGHAGTMMSRCASSARWLCSQAAQSRSLYAWRRSAARRCCLGQRTIPGPHPQDILR